MSDADPFRRPVRLAVQVMPLPRLVLALVLVLMAAAAPAHARTVALGIGELQPGMFSDPYWVQLGIPHARFLTQWDALRHKRERGLLDAWVEAARAAGAQMTIAFTHSHRGSRSLIVGAGGIELEAFLSSPPRDWLDA